MYRETGRDLLSGRSSGSRELKGCEWGNKNPGAEGLWTRKLVALSMAEEVRGQWGDHPGTPSCCPLPRGCSRALPLPSQSPHSSGK